MSASRRTAAAQRGLFDAGPCPEQAEADDARTRMRGMIDRLRAAAAPPWADQMGVILDDGAFQRAMRLVPGDEAQALWAEFDAEMVRLDALWVRAEG